MRKNLFQCIWMAVYAATLGFSYGNAQSCLPERYVQSMFQVDTLKDVVYGNAQSIPLVYVSENVTVPIDLKMDIYQPAGDTLSKRPVVIFAFGGGFLIGSKEDEDVRSVCDSLARRGYVAACINYRLGLNTAVDISAERAVWRGTQDWSAAIRYLKEFHSLYRLDTNAFFGGGVSAGSFAAMHCQYTVDAQRPASTYSAGLPFPHPDLGCKDCSGNNYSHLSSVRALINCWGAIGDTTWIDAQDSVPMLSFHGDLDPIVPYGYGFPFTALLTMPRVYGSSLISLRQNNIGLPNKLNTFVGEGHNVWGTVIANEFTTSESQHWSPILDSIQDFLWEYLKPVSYTIIGALSVYEQDVRNYYVPQIPGGRYCWTVDGGTIVSANPSAASIDVRWDMAGVRSIKVRPVTHLDAVGEETTQLIQVLPATSATASTPTRDLRFATGDGWIAIHSTTLTAQPFSWEITNLQGMVLAAQNQTFPSSSLKISTRDFATGMYLLKIKSKQGLDVHRFWVE